MILYLDHDVKTRIRERLAGNGRSMEEEVRVILRQAVEREDVPGRAWGRRSTSCSSPSAVSNWTCRRAVRCASRRTSIEKAVVVLDTNVLSELVRTAPNAKAMSQ